MIKQVLALAVIASGLATPMIANAQQTGGTTQAPACDCPLGDNGGDLRNLAAFAPLGFLGALAAAGGAPAIFAAAPAPEGPAIASNPTPTRQETETPASDAAGNRTPPPADVPLAVTRPADVPEPVSPDSLRAGMRAPNTATPLPSVFLLGSGLLALGAFTVARAR